MPDFELPISRVQQVFQAAFGTTPLEERVQDLLNQAVAVSRYRDLNHLKLETGDILCSLLQLCNECGWRPDDLVEQTLEKIEQRSEIYKKIGRKLRVGLIMDAFDPVHAGHLNIARAALGSGVIDEVWLMPSFDTIGDQAIAAASERIRMCELAIEGMSGLKVFDYEVKHKFRGERYHLVRKLLGDATLQNRMDFVVITAQGDANDLMSLPSGQQLERLIPFVIATDDGQPPAPNAWYLKPPHQRVSSTSPQGSASSTEIRGMVQRGDARAADYVPAGVLAHIRAHGLYTPSTSVASSRRIAIYSDSFNPPTLAQRKNIDVLLAQGFSQVIIHPAGLHPDRDDQDYSSPLHRAALVSLAFNDLSQVRIDYDDISLGTHRSLHDLQLRYANEGEVWLVVTHQTIAQTLSRSAPLVSDRNSGAGNGYTKRFVLLSDNQPQSQDAELPPVHLTLRVDHCPGCQQLRSMVYHSKPIDHLVHRDVADYIRRHRLYIPGTQKDSTTLQIDDPRLMIVYDDRNAKAVAIAEKYAHLRSDQPNLILVIGGDGTMLRAIREQWRLRLPFVGLNSGHLGFLMNERLPDELDGTQLLSQLLPLLRVDSKSIDGQTTINLAYSDAWLERAEGQAAWMRVEINGETMLNKVVGDGMLVSTASGSSAYARAMGAVPIPIDSPVLTLAGSNIFQPRFWRPMNLPLSSQITLTNLDTINKRPLRAFVDGHPLGLVKEISVRASLTAGVEIAFTREFEPANKLLRSLFPPNQD